VEFFGDKIIIDSSLGRDARLSCLIAGKKWILPPPRSLEWIELIRCTPPPLLLSEDGRRAIVCWKDAPRGIFSIRSVWNSICCLLYRGDMKDVDHLFFDCSFFDRIWYDLCSRCFIPFRCCSWVSTVSWLFNLSGGCSLHSVITRLMLFYCCLLYLEGKECSTL